VPNTQTYVQTDRQTHHVTSIATGCTLCTACRWYGLKDWVQAWPSNSFRAHL